LDPAAFRGPLLALFSGAGRSPLKAVAAVSLSGPPAQTVEGDTEVITEAKEPAPGQEGPAKGAGLNLVGWDKVRAWKPTAVRTVLQTLDGVVYGWKEHEFMTREGRRVVAIELVSPEPKRLSLREAEELISRSGGISSVPPKPEEAQYIPASEMPDVKAMERRFDPNTQKTSRTRGAKSGSANDLPAQPQGLPHP
jgi:hypothetical protein